MLVNGIIWTLVGFQAINIVFCVSLVVLFTENNSSFILRLRAFLSLCLTGPCTDTVIDQRNINLGQWIEHNSQGLKKTKTKKTCPDLLSSWCIVTGSSGASKNNLWLDPKKKSWKLRHAQQWFASICACAGPKA